MKKFFSVFVILFLFVIESHAYQKGKAYDLTILHTNDHHGAFWKNSQGEYGMSARATLIKNIRQEVESKGGVLLLLSGGDINSGTPESEFAKGEPDFKGMSYMGYDAMAVGNHEFDNPLETLFKQRDEWANFPFLSANIYYKKDSSRVFAPYKVFKKGDLNIGVIGLTTDQTPQQSVKFPHDKLSVRSPIEEATELLPELTAKSDVTVALTHMGHYADGKHGSDSPGDVSLARQTQGIDLIVGGHSQVPLFKADYQNGTHIVQAGEWGKHLGRVDLKFKDGKVEVTNYELIPVNLKSETGTLVEKQIVEDSQLLETLRPFYESALATTNQIVGQLKGRLNGDRNVVRKEQTNLGQFTGHIMTQATSAQVAIIASGALRASLEEGDISFGDILMVHPQVFGLKFVTVDFSGQELLDYLSEVAFFTSSAYPQLYGLKVVGENGKILKVEIQSGNGTFQPLELAKTYSLALFDFMAVGGINYPVIDQHQSFQSFDLTDADAMRDFFMKSGSVNSGDFEPKENLQIK